MAAILLSNIRGNTNTSICDIFQRLLPQNSRIAYITSSEDPEKRYFNEVTQFFKQAGDFECSFVGLKEQEWQERFRDDIIDCDALYLAGGNTFDLIHYIRKWELESIIGIFLEKKLVVGTSAGALVLTPSILTSQSENYRKVGNTEGLGLADFYIFPHYLGSDEQKNIIKSLQQTKLDNSKKLYAIDEHAAIIVDDAELKFIGKVGEF